jgi:hypothetical protein
MIASNSQLGPTESGSGNAKYTQAAANIATSAGHLGSVTMEGLILNGSSGRRAV